jgi:tryptophanyl-tRNA synthetase
LTGLKDEVVTPVLPKPTARKEIQRDLADITPPASSAESSSPIRRLRKRVIQTPDESDASLSEDDSNGKSRSDKLRTDFTEKRKRVEELEKDYQELKKKYAVAKKKMANELDSKIEKLQERNRKMKSKIEALEVLDNGSDAL